MSCTDDNECLGDPCPGDTTCENTPGGYICTCAGGYWFDGAACVPGGSTTLSLTFNGSVALDSNGDLRRWGAFPDQAFTGPQGSGTPWTIDNTGNWRQLGRYCGTKNDGSLWCWNGQYQVNSNSPVQIGSDTDWAYVESEGSHACAVKDAGTLWCWGIASDGQLGLPGQTDPVPDPTQVGSDSDWATVAIEDEVTCAIKTNGDLWCWGATQVFNSPGSEVPVQVTTPVAMRFARPDVDGISFTIEGIGVDNRLYRWTALDGSATQIGSDADWTVGELNTEHRCMIKGNGTLWCWGQILNAEMDINHDEPTQLGAANDWVEVSSHIGGSSSGATCARNEGGDIWCIGHNQSGELGDGTIGSRTEPDAIADSGPDFAQVSANIRQTCGVREDGTLWCWGAVDAWDDPLIPVQHIAKAPEQIGVESDWAEVIMGSAFTCARKTSGTLWCWGASSTNWTGLSLDPGVPSLMGPETNWSNLTGGDVGACGLRDQHQIDAGQAVCGIRENGQLWCASGSSLGDQGDPAQIGTDTDWLDVTAGSRDVCGIRGTALPGSVWCGFSGTDNLFQVGGDDQWLDVKAGNWTGVTNVNCGIKADRSLWCWSQDPTWSTGSPTITVNGGIQFGTETDYDYIAGGSGQHICAVTTDKVVRCMGVDPVGMLGVDQAWSDVLVQVNL
jgi:alpha-tubulin suppressor-like RCC1 family protein